jgi:sec-independent protein translocase protein TatB
VFNLSGSEVIIILIIALVVLGPDKLPDFMRRAGRTWAELKKLSSGFQEEVRKGFEEPANEVKRTADTVRKAAAFPKSVGAEAKKEAKKLVYNPLKDTPEALPDGESVAEPDPQEVDAAPAASDPAASESAPATDDGGTAEEPAAAS